MAYSTANPPTIIGGHVARGTEGGQLWLYKDADVETAYDDSGYITNAGDLGMQTGDVVLVIDTTTPAASIGLVTVSSGAGTLTALTAIS